MDFNAYLISKKIDPAAFKQAEPQLWESWRTEFEKISPGSFTAQKLFLINPIRRKYRLAQVPEPPSQKPESPAVENKPVQPQPAVKKPGVAKPVMRPKPKMQ